MESINIFGREIIFLNPEYLDYFLKICLPLTGVWLLVFLFKRLRRPARTLGSAYPLIGVMKFWAKALLVLAITIIALAWPVSKENAVVEKSSVDIIFGIDNSLSMRALDVSERMNRLDIAKREILGLLGNQVIREGDRVAFVNFAKMPNFGMPLSTDLQLFGTLVEELDYTKPLDESYWDTDLNYALREIQATVSRQEEFDESEGIAPRKSVAKKMIILFTDGEDQFFADPGARSENRALQDAVIREFRKMGIKIYSVGIGTQKGFLWGNLLYGYKLGEDYQEYDVRDWGSNRTVLETSLLNHFANLTGGDVFTIENSLTSSSDFLSRVIDSNRSLVAVSQRENEHEWWPYLVRAALTVVSIAIIFY